MAVVAAVAAALVPAVGGVSVAAAGRAVPVGIDSVRHEDDPGRTVGIGDGRVIRLACRGSGSPTVVLVSGTGGAADEWTHAVDPAHPAAGPRPSPAAVLPQVASYTRVCAYDRPGTTDMDGGQSPSTPVPQPTTAAAGLKDLRAVLTAAGEHGPYVLVGASWGAMITGLFLREDFSEVAGVVTVDGASPCLREAMTPDQWAGWMAKIEATAPGKGSEVPAYGPSVAEIRSAPAVPRPVPAVVLTSDRPWDLEVGRSGSTWPAWLAAQKCLARELRARHVTDTGSGHGIAVERPALVAGAVRQVVDQVRAQRRPQLPPA